MLEPTPEPASYTFTGKPRAMRWAAAANPTGPPPITATGRDSKASVSIFYPSRTIEICNKTRGPSSCGDVAFCRGASRVDTALIHQESDQTIHRRIVGAADQRRGVTLLSDQARQNQPVQVVRQGRSGDP